MSKIQPEKTATISEVKSKFAGTSTAVVTEYRGLTVAQISALRRQLRTLGADYKVFKNTLVKRAIVGTDVESLSEFLVGPTAIAFVDGDVSAVAKALRDFAKLTPKLILKGAVVDGKPLSMKDLTALADLPSRDVLLAQFAGLLASPMRTFASLLKAVPQSLAYGLAALIDAKGGVVTPAAEAVEAIAETTTGVEEVSAPVSSDGADVVAESVVEEPAVVEPAVEEATPTEPEASPEAPAVEEAALTEPEADTTEAPSDKPASEPAP